MKPNPLGSKLCGEQDHHGGDLVARPLRDLGCFETGDGIHHALSSAFPMRMTAAGSAEAPVPWDSRRWRMARRLFLARKASLGKRAALRGACC